MKTSTQNLPSELRELVKWSVAIFGGVVRAKVGPSLYRRIEGLRREMSELRDAGETEKLASLRRHFRRLERLPKHDRITVARAYTLLLEMMNVCENAHRTHRLAKKGPAPVPKAAFVPEAIVYVLTAHPTESRAPDNIAVFREIQRLLTHALDPHADRGALESLLRHLCELAWATPIVRDRKPRVRDEAEHIYSTLLQEDILETLLELSLRRVPIYLRSWVGGDKDGHPGVDERAMTESLNLSRNHLLRFLRSRIEQVHASLARPADGRRTRRELRGVEALLGGLGTLRAGDAARIRRLRDRLGRLERSYIATIGSLHPALARLRQLLHIFPGLVVPLELRESSDVLVAHPASDGKLAIDRMLKRLASLAGREDPRWYARGFIVSMTEDVRHLRLAARKVRANLGGYRLPVIPLFENRAALTRSTAIVREMLRDPVLGAVIRRHPNRSQEFMLGYSDSAKENGVIASRYAIAETLGELERLCLRAGVKPVFFHGSGGSVDRGGGSIKDQTAWWPRTALRLYKVTVQGEMIERSLASPEIARGQIEHILESASGFRPRPRQKSASLDRFVERASARYRATIASPEFLALVERATPYAKLDRLRIGSRPAKRQRALSVAGLRAIPWVLCWTQTRVLFPSWWGVGSAWRETPPAERAALRRAARRDPLFATYLKALGFTLAKVELPTWRLYLDASGLPRTQVETAYGSFRKEWLASLRALADLTGHREPLWFRPWLAASIRLRSPLIHPLNLLQVLALRDYDPQLLRLTTTGVASGMLTTG